MSLQTLEQLRTVRTREEWLSDMLALLASVGFNAQSWQPGSVQRTIIECFAYVAQVLASMVASLSYMVFSETSTTSALTALSQSHYSNARTQAISTQGLVRLTGAAIGPPHTVGLGELVVGTVLGQTYRNTAAFTVPVSGTVMVPVEAEIAGRDGNAGTGLISQMLTPLAGVTVTNLVNWTTRLGEEEESDVALRLRNSAKWSTLAVLEGTDERYEYLARTALANCRVKIDSSNPDGPGTLRIYLAAEEGVAGSPEATAVNAAIAAVSFGGPASSQNPYHTTVPATAETLNITGTVFYSASQTTAAACQSAVEAALTAYINGAPIGGYSYGSGANNILDRDGLIDVARDCAGVKKFTLTAPAGDTAVGTNSVATVGTFTITYTATV